MPRPYIRFVTFSTLAASSLLVLGLKQDTLEITNAQLNEQSVLALNWVQQSGEYQALTYQAFNIGQIVFNQAKAKKVRNPAVIVDIDETVLDNSAYQAGFIDTNNSFDPVTWNKWVAAAKAKAVPGAVKFVNYVNDNGGTVFFISNRDKSSKKDSQNNDFEIATINNLKSVGFKGANTTTVLLKGEFTKVIDGKENTSKQWRREAIENGKADGKKYTVIALLGDNLNDFDETAGKSNQERRNHVNNNRQRYGIFDADPKSKTIEPAYIALPNPIYGNWETGLYSPQAVQKQNAWDMSPSQKNQQRKESLTRWLPNQ
ncbi:MULTISPECIES: 5'-nucleotidase, lipoprotein e(P4) family [Nostoc]|uniref:5'-nucleotidase, lipoprotein e(P4) family n=1 Tax=Nostoc paludosum FACHB-159 TaxID=2692908 RepID=A0ABR8KHG4_9NOSO|nr:MULTISPECIES: 5'-nucleotidase, lipoprotein e(P4) family [Nostoc]MBD2682640.1 5'-nucleotidase, lipoprotein e(P4) family [Nostoc sp. FACHB-857]MBD2738973.1 5'-nucleotidase, lipoprotein e(P4) family [Nostoc paludosum FACHB-159]